MTRNEHETEDQCADLLKDILAVREREADWVFHIRDSANIEEPVIRLIASHSAPFSTVLQKEKENHRTGGQSWTALDMSGSSGDETCRTEKMFNYRI